MSTRLLNTRPITSPRFLGAGALAGCALLFAANASDDQVADPWLGSVVFPMTEVAPPPDPGSTTSGATIVYQDTVNGGCVSGSTCITFDPDEGPDGGTIVFPPVPEDSLPIIGFLYFQYLTMTDCSVDVIANFANATINDVNINTLPFVEIGCINDDPCFPQIATHFYRVDISTLFEECDLNILTFVLRNFGMNNSTNTRWVEGATAMVAYCNENLPSTEIILLEEPQVTSSVGATITYTWDGFSADGNGAELVLGVGNGQPIPEEVRFETDSTPPTMIGNDSGNDGLFDGDLCNGSFYDNTIIDVSALVNAGDTTATITITTTSDCLDSNAAFLCVSSQDPPNDCVPEACIESTGSCCNRATGECIDFVAEENCQGPDEVWTEATLCEDLDPPCAQPPTGTFLDIKPGSCPNSFNRRSRGFLPVALLGTDDFDVMQVDLGTLELSRADGVGGIVAPNEGPPGPHSVFDDAATPFEGEPCDCHEMHGDGITDLVMHFSSVALVDALELGDLPAGESVELVLSGLLMDGSSFEASDCVRLVPPTARASRQPESN